MPSLFDAPEGKLSPDERRAVQRAERALRGLSVGEGLMIAQMILADLIHREMIEGYLIECGNGLTFTGDRLGVEAEVAS
jgi:hypothetical protein